MKCYRNTVKRWLDRWQEAKNFSNRSRLRPPSLTTAEENQLIVDLTTKEMNATCKIVKQELKK